VGTSKRERQKAGRQARIAAAQAAAAKRKRLRTGLVFGILVVSLVAVTVVATIGNGDDSSDVATDGTGSSTTATTVAGQTTSTTEDPANVAPTLPEGQTIAGDTPCPPADGSAQRTTTFSAPPPNCLQDGKTYSATFDTTAGEVKVDLDTTTTPIAANNFIVLSRYHYYDGTVVTRTATSIGIIQGGSPHTQTNADPGPGYTIEDEGFDDSVITGGGQGPYRYTAGDLVYARPGGQPDSSSAQWFFCATDDCSNLDSQGIYVKFGHVSEGLDVLTSILADSPQGDAKPNHLVTINTVTINES
jgi:cyclophilin family peptidyl-prolyl cis-trans isomerase